jgi:hypothetical protein
MTISQDAYHPDYLLNQDKWQANHDSVNDRIKDKREKYLPIPGKNPHSSNQEEQAFIKYQYDTVVHPMAVFYNWCRPTLDAILGAIYRKPAKVHFNENDDESVLDYLKFNADGKGNGLEQISRQCLGSQWSFGRGGYLIVWPEGINGSPNRERYLNGDPAPRIVYYSGRNIINWDTDYVRGEEVLSYLALREVNVERINGTSQLVETIITYELDENGHVIYSIEKDLESEIIETGEVIKAGKPATRIPFHLAGADNNDWSIDYAPQTALTELNLLHYKMFSRDMHQRWAAGQAKLVIDVGSDENAASYFGASNGVIRHGSLQNIITMGGNALYISPSTDNLLSETPAQIEEKAIALAANLMSESTNETATAARIRNGGSTSRMAILACNNEEALTNAIKDLAGYLGVDAEDIKFSLHKEYDEDKLTATEMKELAGLVLQGVFPGRSLYELQKKYGYTHYETYEDWKGDVSQQDLLGGM